MPYLFPHPSVTSELPVPDVPHVNAQGKLGVSYEMCIPMSRQSEGPLVHASAGQEALTNKNINERPVTTRTALADDTVLSADPSRSLPATNIIAFAVNGSQGIRILDGKRCHKILDRAQEPHFDRRSYAQYNIFISVSQKHSSYNTNSFDFP